MVKKMNDDLKDKVRQICTYYSELDEGTAGYCLSDKQFTQLFDLFEQGWSAREKELIKKVEQQMLDRILYIGEEVPKALVKDSRSKFILLGNPGEFLDNLSKENGK